MKAARVIGWAAGTLMMILAFHYFPTWREVAVFMVMYIVVVITNMMAGMDIERSRS